LQVIGKYGAVYFPQNAAATLSGARYTAQRLPFKKAKKKRLKNNDQLTEMRE
jgi:hypothetical protein